MSKTFISYVWQHSARRQIYVLFLTILSFPLLYMTLELPKQIINDAVQGGHFPVEFFGFSFDQVPYLIFLCFAYLGFVLTGGLLKMHTNTVKGVIGERLLRRLRYSLIERIMRFPLPYFRRTPQGALISMVTAEAEAIGNMLGEAIARPAFAAGQMLTILAFFFIQNFWLGLAAIAMIPIQAYIVPKLQRKINALNKERIIVVRKLSDQIGETVSGAQDLRANGGVMYTLAQFTKRFGQIFTIRLEIYQRKFFMKFLNNTLNQLTPFLLLLIGGYLVINGELTIGALTAALASYKDLLGPWRDLLSYYSQIQDVSLRYRTITEQFKPNGMIDENLFFGQPETLPRLDGPIVFDKVTVNDAYGNPVLADMTTEIPVGSMVAVRAQGASARRALTQLMSRAVMPASGQLTIAGHDLAALHQGVVTARIGVMAEEAHLFHGGITRNAQMALWRKPHLDGDIPEEWRQEIREAKRVGNSVDPADATWVDYSVAGVKDEVELRLWWAHIIRQAGFEDFLLKRALNNKMDRGRHVDLAAKLVELRPAIRKRLRDEKLERFIHPFDADMFNPGLTAIENILFAAQTHIEEDDSAKIDLAALDFIRKIGAEADHTEFSIDILETLIQTFSTVGTDHPVFRRLSNVSPDMFEELKRIHEQRARGEKVEEDDWLLVLGLPFHITAEQLGDVFPPDIQEELVKARQEYARELHEEIGDAFEPIQWDAYIDCLPMVENLIFGKIAIGSDRETQLVYEIVLDELTKAGLNTEVLLLIGDMETGFGGTEIPAVAFDRIAFVRATIKKPDVLILERPFSRADQQIRTAFQTNLRTLLPDTTIIYIDADIPAELTFDKTYEIVDGALIDLALGADGEVIDETMTQPKTAMGDLNKKLRILSQIDSLSKLDGTHLRLLAYAARWVRYDAGDYVFRAGDSPDGAYIFTSGEGELQWPIEAGGHEVITSVLPGRMIGDMSVFMDEQRLLDLYCHTEMVGLRIERQALNDVIAHDSTVALSLLRTVSGHLSGAANQIAVLTRELDIARNKEAAE